MSSKLHALKELKEKIPNMCNLQSIIYPKRKNMNKELDEEIMLVLKKCNLNCKGCVRKQVAMKLKEIDERQQEQLQRELAQKQLGNPMQIIKRDLLDYIQAIEQFDDISDEKKLSKQLKRSELAQKWGNFEKTIGNFHVTKDPFTLGGQQMLQAEACQDCYEDIVVPREHESYVMRRCKKILKLIDFYNLEERDHEHPLGLTESIVRFYRLHYMGPKDYNYEKVDFVHLNKQRFSLEVPFKKHSAKFSETDFKHTLRSLVTSYKRKDDKTGDDSFIYEKQ